MTTHPKYILLFILDAEIYLFGAGQLQEAITHMKNRNDENSVLYEIVSESSMIECAEMNDTTFTFNGSIQAAPELPPEKEEEIVDSIDSMFSSDEKPPGDKIVFTDKGLSIKGTLVATAEPKSRGVDPVAMKHLLSGKASMAQVQAAFDTGFATPEEEMEILKLYLVTEKHQMMMDLNELRLRDLIGDKEFTRKQSPAVETLYREWNNALGRQVYVQ